MKGIREIKTRLKSVQSTIQITRAMQLVAASKLKRAQNNLSAHLKYAIHIEHMLATVLNHKTSQHIFIQAEVPVNPIRGILLLSSDKGLCGGLNTNLFSIIRTLDTTAQFVGIGKKGNAYLERRGLNLLAEFQPTDHTEFTDICTSIITLMVDLYTKGTIHTIEVIYPRYVNTLVQQATIERILPIVNIKEDSSRLKSRFPKETKQVHLPEDSRQLLVEPTAKSIQDQLLVAFLHTQIQERLLETYLSENSARMVAMKQATDNAQTLIGSLRLQYNKARQASITQEIVEIAAASLNTQ